MDFLSNVVARQYINSCTIKNIPSQLRTTPVPSLRTVYWGNCIILCASISLSHEQIWIMSSPLNFDVLCAYRPFKRTVHKSEAMRANFPILLKMPKRHQFNTGKKNCYKKSTISRLRHIWVNWLLQLLFLERNVLFPGQHILILTSYFGVKFPAAYL